MKDSFENRLLEFLSDGEWHKCKDIAAALGVPKNKVRDLMRPLACFTDGELISNTSKGFKLVEHATADEINHTYFSLLSRAAEIKERASQLEHLVTK